MKRWIVAVFMAGAMTGSVLLSGCGKESPEKPGVAAVQPEPATPQPANQETIQVSEAEVLAKLPASHPVVEGVPAGKTTSGHPVKPRGEPSVVVPDTVKARWKAVTIEVLVQGAEKREIRVVPGETVDLGKDGLSLSIGAFLPSYISNFAEVTSASDNPDNPALQVAILKDGVAVEKGWIFRDYPAFNTVVSEQVALKLTDMHE